MLPHLASTTIARDKGNSILDPRDSPCPRIDAFLARSMPMTRWNYDSDEPASPGLEPVKPRWDPPSPSPPPRTTLNNKEGSTSRTDSSQPSSSHGASRSGRARLKVQPSQGDVVLLNFLAPNRPDIANEAGRHALIPSDDERDSTSEEDEVMSDASQLQQTASDARAAIAGESLAQLPRHHPQQSIPPVTSNPLPPPPSNWRSPPTAPAPMASAVASRPYEPHGAISDGAHLAGRPEYAYPTSSASPAPPTLHKSTSSSSASRDSQRSHPSDIKLPPVSTLLDAANQDPRSSHSSHRTYPESTTSLSPTGPGAYDYVRPSQPYYNTTGRTPQDNSPPGTTNYFAQAGQSPHSAYASYSSGNIQRFPPGSSSSNQPTPASGSTEPYNTPSTHTTPTERQTSASAESVPSAASGPTYGAVPGGFKCTYDGCTAQPFQTQYLLKCVSRSKHH